MVSNKPLVKTMFCKNRRWTAWSILWNATNINRRQYQLFFRKHPNIRHFFSRYVQEMVRWELNFQYGGRITPIHFGSIIKIIEDCFSYITQVSWSYMSFKLKIDLPKPKDRNHDHCSIVFDERRQRVDANEAARRWSRRRKPTCRRRRLQTDEWK